MTAPRHGQAGITLVELMISVVISGIVISAALAMGFSLMNSYRDNRAVMLVERSGRVSLEIVVDAIRGASAGASTGQIVDAVGCDPDPSALRVENVANGPDRLRAIYASGGVLTSLRASFSESDNTLSLNETAGIVPGDMLIVSNLATGVIVRVLNVPGTPGPGVVTIEAPTANCPGLTFLAPFDATGVAEPIPLVIRGKIARFYIEDGADTGNKPTLMMDPDGDAAGDDPEPIAEGIEDMQIAVGVDLDGNGSVFEDEVNPATDEWHFNDPADAPPPPMSATPWRGLRVTIVARTLKELSDVDQYARPLVEDHDPGTGLDPFRRRVLTSTVEVRNIVGSP